MTLTLGSGPFGHHPGGVFNFAAQGPKHAIYFESFPRRVRAEFGGETVLDTVEGKLLHESFHLPVLYVPEADLNAALLEGTEHTTHCPFKGDAGYRSVRAGDRVAENAVWAYREPLDSAPWLAGYASVEWDAMDAWYEEDEPVVAHLRDPYHRVDVRRSSGRVSVTVDGEEVARSDRPVLVFETGLPPRSYIPRDDLPGELLAPSAKTSVCPYKGTATWYSLRVTGEELADTAWSYDSPLGESGPLAGLVSFDGEGIELRHERVGARAGAAAT